MDHGTTIATALLFLNYTALNNITMTGPPISGNMLSGINAVESDEVIDDTDFEEVMKERNRVSYEYSLA
jgi:hypothetical protein